MSFNPDLCRNESEVESKLIVSYLLPKLGYGIEHWHQEVTLGSIRLDFLSFAAQKLPFRLDGDSPLSLVMEAKHPRENLDRHQRKLRRYLTSINVKYGLLTNAKEIRIYQRLGNDIELVFSCWGIEIDEKIEEIKALIGRDYLGKNLNYQTTEITNEQVNENTVKLTDETGKPGKEENKNQAIATQSEIDKIVSNMPENQRILANPETDSNQINQSRRNPMKVIAVYHNKGGVGKTTTVVNLAAAFSKKGYRVLVIDLDSQANTTFATSLIKFNDEQFDDIKDSNIYHVLRYDESSNIPEVARVSRFNEPEVHVIPSHISLMRAETEFNNLRSSLTSLIKKLKPVEGKYDVVLLDTPPSFNLYAFIPLVSANYLIIPSDLKPFANQGLSNVKNYLHEEINSFRQMMNKPDIEILGVLPCKINPNNRFVKYTLPKQIQAVSERYELSVMETVIFQREELARCIDKTRQVGDLLIPEPSSIFDYAPDSSSCQEFESLANEVLNKIGLK
ncbi:AAA family ATPase [Okeania sp. SIO2C9]|uniref:AAA family ATPase n=1 Tax=Okeania sp. SIO2C9 TaxID=2607791 RepID=UPI0025FE0C92|nr:AAA family ATPase [Okeania sp. SIO2C9]